MMFREYISVSARNASSGEAISLNSIQRKLPIGNVLSMRSLLALRESSLEKIFASNGI